MSPLERFLLIGIFFLIFVRVFLMPDAGPDAGRDTPEFAPNEVAEETAAAPGAYDWNPASFTRRGIPAKLTLTSDGRIPDSLRLNDTQKAFVYAAMIESYDQILTRAHEDCDPSLRRDIVRWQARFARTIADAEQVLQTLTPGRDSSRSSQAKMPSQTFKTRLCPTIEHYLATSAYNPHAEAVDRLSQAARGFAPSQ